MVLWALLDVIGMGIDESEYVKNGMLFVSWKTIMFYIMLILGSTVLVQWHNRRSFHRILGAWYTYLIAYGVLAVGFKFVLYLLSSCFHVSTFFQIFLHLHFPSLFGYFPYKFQKIPA